MENSHEAAFDADCDYEDPAIAAAASTLKELAHIMVVTEHNGLEALE